MKRRVLLSALTALGVASLAFSGIALADDDRGRGRGRNDRDGRRGRNDQDGRDDRRGERDDRRDEDRGPQSRGAGPNHSFRRGSRLPPEYRDRYYVVEDWRGHRLSAPPRGYHWVQTGGDYVLVSIPTGLIIQINLGP
ncbi:RcnB family protein [Polaromonas sp.]|uniref:RcnB family protein n=1 Tax=Polaromonas sp. TaxID=1869339 RepID=UPI00286B492E|nr:RcnB family protein [Polaromonas sp.]